MDKTGRFGFLYVSLTVLHDCRHRFTSPESALINVTFVSLISSLGIDFLLLPELCIGGVAASSDAFGPRYRNCPRFVFIDGVVALSFSLMSIDFLLLSVFQ